MIHFLRNFIKKIFLFKLRNSLFVILFLFLIFVFSSFIVAISGSWVEDSYSMDPSCNGFFHVICAEKNTAQYDTINKLIPYSEDDSVNFPFCAITQSSDLSTRGFRAVEVNSLDDLKQSTLLAKEFPNSISYDGASPFHYDENCNGDEMFEKKLDGSLDLSTYIENGVSYDVFYDESLLNDNIDNFDIIGCDSCGAIFSGTVRNSESNEVVKDVNVTLYFKNSKGTFKPYLSFISNENGYFSSINSPRTIVTYFRTVENVVLVPRTKYLVVAKNKGFEDFISENAILAEGNEIFDISLKPFGGCNNDCTYLGSNLCRAECDGINGCNFPVVDGISFSDKLNLWPKTVAYYFKSNGVDYKIQNCEDLSYSQINNEYFENEITCPDGKSVWNTEKLVKYQGQLVKMKVTYCK